jgi:hypothetical protein
LDAVWHDRRHGFETRGRDQWISALQHASGTARRESLVATRGERLALDYTAPVQSSLRAEPGPSPDAAVLSLTELDDGGQVAAISWFGSHDLDAAIADLDSRFAAASGEPSAASVLRVIRRFTETLNARDYAGVRDVIADELDLIDRRHVSLGTIGKEEAVEAARTLRELAPDLRTWCAAVHRLVGARGVAQFVDCGTTAEGSNVELSYLSVFEQRGGRVARAEWYSSDDLAVALTRFEEIGPD